MSMHYPIIKATAALCPMYKKGLWPFKALLKLLKRDKISQAR